MSINAIVAVDAAFGIGKNNGLPWPHEEEDMKWFRSHTKDNVVVMGRKTWESIGSKPLPKRVNIVITNSKITGDYDEVYYGDMGRVLQTIQMNYKGNVWVIGGANIYEQAIPFCDHIYLTKFHETYDCDTFIDKNLMSRFVEMADREAYSGNCNFSIWRKI